MQVAYNTSPDNSEAQRAIDLLFDTALISSGFTVCVKFSYILFL